MALLRRWKLDEDKVVPKQFIEALTYDLKSLLEGQEPIRTDKGREGGDRRQLKGGCPKCGGGETMLPVIP